MSDWQPIETAPHDVEVWVFYEGAQFPAKFYDYDYTHLPYQVRPANKFTGWLDSIVGEECHPTHWIPMPPPPISFIANEQQP
jgi:hypothetical protein